MAPRKHRRKDHSHPPLSLERVEQSSRIQTDSAALQRAISTPSSLSPADIMQLQRLVGNQAVSSLLTEINQSKGSNTGRATGQPIIQARLDRDAFYSGTDKSRWGVDTKGLKRYSLTSAIDAYNDLEEGDTGSQTSLHQLMEQLDTIEHKVYRWFDETKTDTDNPNRLAMFKLLDDVQSEHKRMVARMVKDGRDLWVKDDGGEDNADIQTLWGEIISGRGNFKLAEKVFTETGAKDIPEEFLADMRLELYATFARLMSRPRGRQLLSLFKSGDVDEHDLEFVLTPLYKIMDEFGPSFGPSLATNKTSGAGGLAGKGGKLTSGPGSGTRINFAPGAKDSTVLDTDKDGNPILSPTFLGFGHEISHGAHYKKGNYFPALKLTGLPKEYGTDGYGLEEMVNIAPQDELKKFDDNRVKGRLSDKGGDGSTEVDVPFSQFRKLNKNIPNEGDIRQEHGLTLRHGHLTTMPNPHFFKGFEEVTESRNWAKPLNDVLNPPKLELLIDDKVDILVDKTKHKKNKNGKNKKKCYITTACTRARGLPDTCEELTVLRAFRDEYLRWLPGGETLISLYYEYGPAIVDAIDGREDAPTLYESLYERIRYCVDAIKGGQYGIALESYLRIVLGLHAVLVPQR